MLHGVHMDVFQVLYRLRMETLCDTHDLLECDCECEQVLLVCASDCIFHFVKFREEVRLLQ